MTAMERAIEQFAAMGAANRAWDAKLAGDARYQFLLSVAAENRITFEEEGSFAGVAAYNTSSRSSRRRRAMLLAQVRQAKLFDGCQCFGKYRDRITYCRRLERLDVASAECAKPLPSPTPAQEAKLVAAVALWRGKAA